MKKLIITLLIGSLIGSSFANRVWAEDPLYTRVNTELCSVASSDDRNYWVGRITEDPNGQGSAWTYWVHRMDTGDGVGKAPPGTNPLCGPSPAPPMPAPAPPSAPPLVIDYTELLKDIDAHVASIDVHTQNIDHTFMQTVATVGKFVAQYGLGPILAYLAARR